jgi:hypothetical protein
MSRSSHFRPFLTIATVRTELYVGLHRLCEVLADPTAECLEKQSGAFTFMAAVQQLYGVRGLDHEPGKEDRIPTPGLFYWVGEGLPYRSASAESGGLESNQDRRTNSDLGRRCVYGNA